MLRLNKYITWDILTHYVQLIRVFGAPNGLCSLITESKHIKAVKEPWRHSNCFNALGQMLLTNQRLDKLAAAHVNFTHHGMLQGIPLNLALSRLGMYISIMIKYLVADTV